MEAPTSNRPDARTAPYRPGAQAFWLTVPPTYVNYNYMLCSIVLQFTHFRASGPTKRLCSRNLGSRTSPHINIDITMSYVSVYDTVIHVSVHGPSRWFRQQFTCIGPTNPATEHAFFSAHLTRNARGGRTLAQSPPSHSSPPLLPNRRLIAAVSFFSTAAAEPKEILPPSFHRRRIHLLHRRDPESPSPPQRRHVTPGFRRQTECEPCMCQDQQFTYTAVT
jgi:hypothetical protein